MPVPYAPRNGWRLFSPSLLERGGKPFLSLNLSVPRAARFARPRLRQQKEVLPITNYAAPFPSKASISLLALVHWVPQAAKGESRERNGYLFLH